MMLFFVTQRKSEKQGTKLFMVVHLTLGAFLLCLLFPIKTYAQTSYDISMFANKAVDLITNKDGLPQGTIQCMATDSSGRFWVGTQDGAAYYDQRKWTTVNMPRRTISNWVQSMFVASDGAVWFGMGRGGVHRYTHGRWESFDTSDGLVGRTVRGICETKEDNGVRAVWFATDRGLSKFAGGKWQTYTKQNGLVGDIINDVCNSTNGALWAGTSQGVSMRYRGEWLTVDVPDGMKDKSISKIFQSSNGAMWFGAKNVIARYNKGEWSVFSVKRGAMNSVVYAIYQRMNGEIWFGTESGLWKFNDLHGSDTSDTPQSVSLGIKRTGKDGMFVISIHETYDGSLWFGTFSGLYRYNDGNWQFVVENMGAAEGGTSAICETSNGDFWFGTVGSGLVRYSNGRWYPHYLISGIIIYLYESKDQSLWVSLYNNGVFRYKDQTLTKYNKVNGLASNSAWFTYQTRDGSLWFGGDGGVSKYALGKWETLTDKEGLPGNTVLSMCETSDGSLWFGTTVGVSRFRNGKHQTYDTRDGLGANTVQCIFEPLSTTSTNRESKAVWFGTRGNGVSRFDLGSKTWRTFNDITSPRLSNNTVYSIKEDKLGRLYFLTNNGVTRFTFLGDGKIKSEIFTMEDGLPNNEGNFGSSIVDSRGRIWVGTTEGAAFFNPSAEVVDTVRKPLFIRDVAVSRLVTKQPLESGVVLKHNQNEIVFHFSLSSFFKESDTRYQVQLNGYDANRLDWTSDNKKEYTNLPDGNYTFRVWGKDYAGNMSGPTKFMFIIEPPYWKTWWFRIFLFLVSVGVILMIGRIYTARKLKKQLVVLERQRMIEQERTRISRDMHDTVGSSLTRIVLLSNRVDKEMKGQSICRDDLTPIQHRVSMIEATAREVMSTMDEIIWSLSPKHDTLESLISYVRYFINVMFESAGIQYKINVPESIPDITLSPDFRRNTFLIVKEAVNNIVKHSCASSVSIVISLPDNKLAFEVIDNGVGISESVPPLTDGVGFGLKNMRERAEAIGANLAIETIPQRGTSIQFSAELQKITPV